MTTEKLKQAKANYKPDFTCIWHSLTFLCLLGSTICIGLTFLDSFPIESSLTSPVDFLGHQLWLMSFNDTVGSDKKRYALGVFGWCEWGNQADDLTSAEACTKMVGWNIPRDADVGDDILNLDLPFAVTHVLGPISFCLLVPFLYSLILFTLHALSFKYHRRDPHEPQMPLWKWLPSGDPPIITERPWFRRQRRIARLVRYFWITAPSWTLFSLGGVIGTLVCCGMGHVAVSGSDKYKAELGIGFQLLVGALVSQFLALLIIWIAGLYRHKFNPDISADYV